MEGVSEERAGMRLVASPMLGHTRVSPWGGPWAKTGEAKPRARIKVEITPNSLSLKMNIFTNLYILILENDIKKPKRKSYHHYYGK
jgi:hypothetical protein